MRKKAWDDAGVAEVVGTILILAMTVVLFSGIILWVSSFPTPEASLRLEMEGVLQPIFDTGGTMIGANVTLTHRGGEELLSFRTDVIRVIDDGTTVDVQVFKTRGTYAGQAYGLLDGGDDDWNINERWSLRDPAIDDVTATVTITIVDTIRSTILWQSNLQPQVGDHPPLFLEKWADGDTATLTIDTPRTDLAFGLYARVLDQDGDLVKTSVWAELTFGPGGTPLGAFRMYDDGTRGDRVANDGIFSRVDAAFQPLKSWDGGIVIFNATDAMGRETTSRLVLQVVEGPGGTTVVGGGGQGPFDLFFSNEFQAYEIYNATEWDKLKWAGNGTRTFKKGETVVVVVASQYLKNLELRNDFFLYDPSVLPVSPLVYGNAPYNDPVGATTRPSSTAAFTYLEFTGDFYVYEYRFNTSSDAYGYDGVQLAYGQYSLAVELRASNVPPPRNRFATVDTISVTDLSGVVPDYPKVEFFKDAAHTQAANEFNFTDTMYVKVTVNDTDGSVVISDVVISDFIGGVQIWTTPGNPPITATTVNDSRSYAFAIDLSNPNRDAWVFGRNSYGFRIKELSDSNEQYALANQVVIRGPRWSLDVITALEDFEHPVFDEKWYAIFYDNDKLWSRYVVERFASIPGQTDPDWGGEEFLDVAFGDLDEDGDLDAVVGIEVGRIFWYRNALGTGQTWDHFEVDNLGNAVEAVAIGKIDRDTDNDIVAGTRNGEVWHYNNDGQWTPNLVANVGSAVNVLKLADVTGDGFNDIVIGTQNGEVRIYINDGLGGFGTQLTADYVLATDFAVEGTVTGTVANTQVSDDVYEAIQEVLGSGESTEVYLASAELVSQFDTVVSGTYTATQANDGTFQVLEEEFYDGPGINDKWMLRNSTGGAAPGHQYAFGSIASLDVGAGETATVTVNAFLSQGTEAMEVGFKVGTGGVTVLGTISETAETTKTFDLSASGFAGGNLYIVIQDSDTSNNDGSSDGQATRISIDFVEVRVTRLAGTTSRLEHKWQTQTIGTGGDAYKLFVEAHHTFNGETDDFRFQWSTGLNGPWTDLLTVTKTADNDLYQTANLPTSVAGTQIYVRVVDTNRTANATELDTLYVDHVFVRRFISVPNFSTISVGVAVNDVVVADMDRDGDNDVVVAAGNNAVVYFGTDWSSSQSLQATGTVLALDVGYIDADGNLDVVVGTKDGKVYWFANDGTWARTLVADLGSDVTTLRVGDVDGDFWDDIVVGTENGYIRWFRHDKGTSWVDLQIDKLDTTIFALDIGDVDRGVIIDPAD
jgi:hypothetical protein